MSRKVRIVKYYDPVLERMRYRVQYKLLMWWIDINSAHFGSTREAEFMAEHLFYHNNNQVVQEYE